jgi:hypothetical protein
MRKKIDACVCIMNDCGLTSGSGWVAVVSIDSSGCGGHFEMKMLKIGAVLSEIFAAESIFMPSTL